MKPVDRRSALGLIVLGMLYEEPMHPYRMQKLMRQRGKHRVVNVRQRASVYQAIDRLLRLGLIRVRETVSSERRPDRTIYEITDLGRETAPDWLRQALRATEEFPEFVAALSLLMGLTPEDALAQLEARRDAIAAELADVESTLLEQWTSLTQLPGPTAEPHLARLFLIEEEYRQAVLGAQLRWLEGVVEDLRTGRLAWDQGRLRELAAAFEEDHDA